MLGLTLSPALLPFAPVLAFLTAALASATILAAVLAGDFSRESTEATGWFTKSNFADFSGKVGKDVAAFLGVMTAIGDAFIVLGPLSIAFGAGVRVGSLASIAVLGGMALANIHEQEQVLFGDE
jgi:hypothetical protein